MDLQEVLRRFTELFSVKVLILLAVFIISIISSIAINRRLTTKKGDRNAKHSVKANLKSGSVYHYGEGKYGSATDKIGARYTYMVDGKAYEYSYMERQVPAAFLTLYYNDDPKHAWWDGERSWTKSIVQLLVVLMPFAVTAVVGLIIGIE